MRISPAAANTIIDALTALLNGGGTLEFFTGSPPAATGDADSGTKLATLPFSSTAFGAGSLGVATANAITSDTDCAATGNAGHWRAKDPEGTVVAQGSVGLSGAEINLNNILIVQHGTLTVDALTWTQPQA